MVSKIFCILFLWFLGRIRMALLLFRSRSLIWNCSFSSLNILCILMHSAINIRLGWKMLVSRGTCKSLFHNITLLILPTLGRDEVGFYQVCELNVPFIIRVDVLIFAFPQGITRALWGEKGEGQQGHNCFKYHVHSRTVPEVFTVMTSIALFNLQLIL